VAGRRSKTKSVRGTLSDARLPALLDDAHAMGGIQACRNGLVNRAYYARELGCTTSALTRFRHVFEEYEKRIGIATGPMRYFTEMRDWLGQEYEAGRVGPARR